MSRAQHDVIVPRLPHFIHSVIIAEHRQKTRIPHTHTHTHTYNSTSEYPTREKIIIHTLFTRCDTICVLLFWLNCYYWKLWSPVQKTSTGCKFFALDFWTLLNLVWRSSLFYKIKCPFYNLMNLSNLGVPFRNIN